MTAHRIEVVAAYQGIAAAYARAADPLLYRVSAGPLVAAVQPHLGSRTGPVLDVAAGAGAFGRAFGDVVALDATPAQLACNGADRKVCADAELLPFRDDSFVAAGCAFGINHLLHPERAVREMARVAPVVAVSTWCRPERPYAPKQLVQAALARQVGSGRSALGESLDRLGERVGSVDAVSGLLTAAGVDGRVEVVEVEVPWPGVDAYLDYRLAMPSTPEPEDRDALREEVASALTGVSQDALRWFPQLVIGVGVRRGHSPVREPADEQAAGTESVAQLDR